MGAMETRGQGFRPNTFGLSGLQVLLEACSEGKDVYSVFDFLRPRAEGQISFKPGFGAYQSLAQKIKVPFSMIFFFFLQFRGFEGDFKTRAKPRYAPNSPVLLFLGLFENTKENLKKARIFLTLRTLEQWETSRKHSKKPRKSSVRKTPRKQKHQGKEGQGPAETLPERGPGNSFLHFFFSNFGPKGPK